MATKCIVLGQPEQKKKGKPIEFVKVLNVSGDFGIPCKKPSEWEVVELIAESYGIRYDLMFAYNEIRSAGCAYLGHWNDGYVE